MERRMGEEILKISIDGEPVGMVGLEEVFSRAKDKKALSQVEIEKFLLAETKKKYFIPAKMEGIYAQALVKAFKKYCGEEVEEGPSGLQVRILGGGCSNCQKLERETLSALDELHLAADFDKEEDPRKIAESGVLGIPALVINGKVKSVGRVPPRGQIKKWLLEESAGK
jgi:hypothetical protein